MKAVLKYFLDRNNPHRTETFGRGMKFNLSHRFCCIPIETKELAGQHDWDDYEFQDRTPNTND